MLTNKVISVFYGADWLPYKDSARTIHFPVTGSTFAGTNQTAKIRFYVRDIGGTSGISWVLVSKLPNGKLGYEPIASVGYDSKLGENYIEFELSSYYTQYKGVLKLALRGYQGDITFTEDSQGVYEISGNPIIGVTGTIDFAINYAPMVQGGEFLPTELDDLLAYLSGYVKNGNAIIVVPDITQVDLSDYEYGQIFLNLDPLDNFYYEYNEDEEDLVRISNGSGVISSGNYFLNMTYMVNVNRTQQTIGDLFDITDKNAFLLRIDNKDYIFTRGATQHNGKTPVRAICLNNGFVYNTISSTIFDSFPQDLINNSYKLETAYIREDDVSHILDIGNGNVHYDSDDDTIRLQNANGDELVVGENGAFYNGDKLATEDYVDSSLNNYYTKAQTDSAIASALSEFKENEISVVNTTTYPTLNDFLATTGQEGFIYLYPIDTTDLTKGYYRYVWENNTWLALGTTEIDLSNYYTKSQVDSALSGKVDKTQTIAGIALSGNISASDLANAINDDLNFMNTTTDIDYVMEDE